MAETYIGMGYFQLEGSEVILQVLPAHAGLQAADLHAPICFAARSERRGPKIAPAIVSPAIIIAPSTTVIIESVPTAVVVKSVPAPASYFDLHGHRGEMDA